MNKNINKTLNDFLSDEEQENQLNNTPKNNNKKIKSKDGLIERINKKLIVEDGRQMLLD